VDRRAFLCLVHLAGRGQEPPVFSATVKVVNVLATVRGRDGAIASGLEREDFTILENGRPQQIRYFARESGLPLVLGLLIDTSFSQEQVLAAQRGASLRFLDQVLRPDRDQVFLMQFDENVRLRQPLTASVKDLAETLAFIDTPSRTELRAGRGNGTALYDAVATAARGVLAARTGRKAMIVLSDGVDYGSNETLASCIEAAVRAESLVYTILFAGDSGRSGAGVLERMARETGGASFAVSKREPIDSIFARIEQELRTQYSLGFVSDVPVRISEFRTLAVAVNRPGFLVRARPRYWAQR
jgi:VWFA-related protein